MRRVQCRQWKFGKCRGYQYPWYRVCTKPMFISKGSYGYGEAKNAFSLSVQITHWTLRTSNLYHVSCIAYSAANENLEKVVATNTLGTVFALSRCLYQKEATGMERLKMHSLCRWKERTGRYELPTYTMFHASRTVPRMEIWKKSWLPIPLVPCLH